MEKPSLRIIQGERGDGEKTPSRYLSDKQRLSLEKVRRGFEQELREDGSLMWSRLTSPNGLRDQEGAVWEIWVDKERQNTLEGWQVWRCLSGEQEFGWVDIAVASCSKLPKVPGYPDYETAQIELNDGGLLNIVRVVKYCQRWEKVYVQKFGENKIMEEVPPNLKAVVGAKATAGVVRDPQIA